jgi:hypothetical protein
LFLNTSTNFVYTCLSCILALQEYYAYFGYAINVTTVRKMAESEIFVALQQGNVTYTQYLQSCAFQGHSEETAKKYYRISKTTIANTETAYATMMGDESTDTSVLPVSLPTTTTTTTNLAISAAADVPVGLSTPSRTKRALDVTTPPSSAKRALTDKVVAQEARQEIISRVADSTQDGVLHPLFLNSTKKVPASDSEKTWLFNYFKGLPELRGNYFRYLHKL